jgi:hypothetical protein
MTKQQPDCHRSEVRFLRATSPKLLHRRPSRRRGQTLVEYVLILAYVGVFTIQAMESLAFITVKEYVYTNCTLIIGNMQGQSQTKQMSAVDNYLSDPSIWQHADANKIASAVSEVHATMHKTIYGY